MFEDRVNNFQIAWKQHEEAHNNFVAAKNEDETIPEDEDYINTSLGEYMEVTNKYSVWKKGRSRNLRMS